MEMNVQPPHNQPQHAPILHLYGQGLWHDNILIAGNRAALSAPRKTIDMALSSKRGEANFAAIPKDGEGYVVFINKVDDDFNWEETPCHIRIRCRRDRAKPTRLMLSKSRIPDKISAADVFVFARKKRHCVGDVLEKITWSFKCA